MMKHWFKKSIATLVILGIDVFMMLSIPSQVKVFSDTKYTSRSMPYLVTTVILICCVWDLVESAVKERNHFLQSHGQNTDERLFLSKEGFLRVLAGVLAIAVWGVILQPVGFLISSIALAVVMMLLMGNRNILQLILIPVLLSACVYILFKEGLHLRLPKGIFFF